MEAIINLCQILCVFIMNFFLIIKIFTFFPEKTYFTFSFYKFPF